MHAADSRAARERLLVERVNLGANEAGSKQAERVGADEEAVPDAQALIRGLEAELRVGVGAGAGGALRVAWPTTATSFSSCWPISSALASAVDQASANTAPNRHW